MSATSINLGEEDIFQGVQPEDLVLMAVHDGRVHAVHIANASFSDLVETQGLAKVAPHGVLTGKLVSYVADMELGHLEAGQRQ